MPETTNELILEVLRRIQADIADLKADVREIRSRIGNFELRMAHMKLQFAELSVRMDRRDGPVERILRRLKLADYLQ